MGHMIGVVGLILLLVISIAVVGLALWQERKADAADKQTPDARDKMFKAWHDEAVKARMP